VIAISDLRKTYGEAVAVDSSDLQFESGEGMAPPSITRRSSENE